MTSDIKTCALGKTKSYTDGQHGQEHKVSGETRTARIRSSRETMGHLTQGLAEQGHDVIYE